MQSVHRDVSPCNLDPRFRDLCIDEDAAFLEAHAAVMRPGAEALTMLPDSAPFTFELTSDGLAVTFTGDRDRETHELLKVADICRLLGYDANLHRDRRRTVLYLTRPIELRRAA